MPLGMTGLMFTAFTFTLRDKRGNVPSGSVTITIVSSSKSWKYLHCHDISWLADGEPVHTGKSKHDGRVGRGYVLEFIEVEVRSQTFLRMVQASVLRGKLCNTEFDFSPERRQTLLEFVAKSDL